MALMGGGTAAAQEWKLGDYIYVPAMQVAPVSGSISLRVEGLSIGAEGDEPVTEYALAGAEFGVYVFSGTGELTPWANPLYPSEPMRIRTGEAETYFSLPQGAEYYLRQESAPNGYSFDDEALIPVTEGEIVVQNAMAGQLVISAVDSLGTPISGVEIHVDDEDGNSHVLLTNENGEAVLQAQRNQGFSIREGVLPEGVFAALSVSGGETDGQGVYAQVSPARRTRVVFEHPASGSVMLDMKLSVINEQAEQVLVPLRDVRMDILSDPAISLLTDEQGQAGASVLEGVYAVRLSYEGDLDVIMPLSEGQMIVSSGSTTLIELSACENTGRIVVAAQAEKALEGGKVQLVSEETGRKYGPYAIDADGLAVSEPLEAGAYRISEFALMGGVQFGSIACEGIEARKPEELMLEVTAGKITQADVQLLTQEKQMFGLVAESVDGNGEVVQNALGESLSLVLRDAQGQETAVVDSLLGIVTIEALSGQYTLHVNESDAQRLGIQSSSAAFDMPTDAEVIRFPADHTRLVLSAVDENGLPAPGGAYQLTDSVGMRFEVVCDEDGMAVTPLMAPGEVVMETLDAPAGHAAAAPTSVLSVAGQAASVRIYHESLGVAAVSVSVKSLDENGQAVYAPVQGVQVRLFRVSRDGHQTDTGIVLVTDEAGFAQTSLEEGEYAAVVEEQTLAQSWSGAQAVHLSVRNTQQADVQLICRDALGGVEVCLTGGELSDEELAQVRFEIVDADGSVTELQLRDGMFYAGGLFAGEYVLRQTQIPQGYTLASQRSVTLEGGEVVSVAVPLEEYALLSVSKTGLTFDHQLNTFVVPLSGQYGVYTMEEGEMKPYPDLENQQTLWANVTPQEIAQGKIGSVKLPVAVEGSTYYLRELTQAPGFAPDENYYEIRLFAGEETTLNCAVSSDRGFFMLDAMDAVSGVHVPGGAFELLDKQSGEIVLAFEMGDEAYQNRMAVPVGEYTLRQTKAAPGYTLSEPYETDIVVEPYLSEGGKTTHVQMTAAAVPSGTEMELFTELYTAQEQGLSLLCVDAAQVAQPLLAPVLTVSVDAVGSERSDIASIVIAGTGDAVGTSYLARVEYCLDGGGWQYSDARMTGVLTGPTAVSLDDVRDDICAVRITYIDADTLEERAGRGFTPGQVTLNMEASAQSEVNMQADAVFSGQFAYQTELGGRMHYLERMAKTAYSFVMQAEELFETVSAGRDGKISGIAFFDEDADGVMDGGERSRYAGLTVTLQTLSGEVLDTVRTDSDGRYAFQALSGGEYRVRFDAGESVVFSNGEIFSEHVISGVEDTRDGTSANLVIDGDHTDYLVNVGCIFASEISGNVLERMEEGQLVGFTGMTVEMRAAYADADEEPLVVLSGGMGEFSFTRLLPGEYEITMEIPQGYLCREAADAVISRTIQLGSGESFSFDALLLEKEAAVHGTVRVDDNGDGVIASDADVLEGVRVVLLASDAAHTEQIAQTQTDAYGEYAFEHLYPGEYSVLFELEGDWAFTRFGENSQVYGAVSQSGSTQTFSLEPGETKLDIDAGVTIPARLTVGVFEDAQYDGLKGVYEKMLSDISITLIRLENGQDAETVTYTTGENGTVVFEGVSPGEYALAYELPGLWRTTKQAQSENYPVSCVPQSMLSTGRSEPFVLDMNRREEKLFIGVMLSGSISGVIYYDDDADAKRDENEAACADVTAELLNTDQQVVASTTPDAEGRYAFDGLAPGRYTVRFLANEGCGFSGTERTASRNGVLESEGNVSSTRIIWVTAGQTVSSANAGVVRLASISGNIWEDRNADRFCDEQESVMAGLNVHLMDGAGRNILRSTTTDELGRYAFDHLKPATYKIRMDAPEAYVFSGALAGSVLELEAERDGRGYSAPFALLGGVEAQNVSFGLLTQGTIGGFVWEDNDFNGRMGAEEMGMRGTDVTLLDANGNEIASRQTLRSGEFIFDQLMPGSYALRVTLPEGYAFTMDGAESVAPHAAQTEAVIDLGALSMGGEISDVRIGMLKESSIGGVVWLDQDDDGRRQNGDQGVSGVRARLEMMSGADAGKTYEVLTDETGAYRFDGIMPGEAMMTFELADGYAFARRVSGTRRVSSVEKADSLTASTEAFGIACGDNRTDFDVGVVGVGTISGHAWEDVTYDGRYRKDETGVSGVTVELIDTLSGKPVSTATTDETGAYQLGFVRKGEYRLHVSLPDGRIFTRNGDSMIADLDAREALGDAFVLAMGESMDGMDVGTIVPASLSGRVVIDENEDGICGEDEAGLAGAVVTAMQGGTVIATAHADDNGEFFFDMLRPGTYRLRYVLSDETLFARNAHLNMTDADAMDAETGEYSLSMGEAVRVDAVGVVRVARIAGRAWMDENVNGSMDESEPALSGVTAQLVGSNGSVIAQRTVESDGTYSFERLRSGSYSVRFAIPHSVLFTDYTGKPGDSCVPVTTGSTAETETFRLAMGEQRIDMNVGGILPGSIGDTVWYDKDGNGLQDYKEPLIPGVSLTLLYVSADGTMTEVGTMQSDKYGYYAFESLRPGTYVLRMNTQEGDTLTSCFGAPLGEIDSDLDPDTGMSAPIALQSGQTLRNIDVGLTEHAD